MQVKWLPKQKDKAHQLCEKVHSAVDSALCLRYTREQSDLSKVLHSVCAV